MKSAWPIVPLGEVLRETRDSHPVDREKSYPNFGIYSYARGVFAKPPIEGMATSASMLYRARAGQFVYSRLFAFEGAYAVVPAEMDGHFVSNEFPLFDADAQRLLPGFLHRYISIPRIWREIAEMSTGVGHRRQRVHPDQLLTFRIPLPPLAEQRRIVARIEELAAKIAEARSLCGEAAVAVEQLCRSLIFGRIDRCTLTAMGELVSRRPLDVDVRPDETYQFAGVYCFGRGVFRSKRVSGSDFAYRQLTRLRANDFVYPKLMAWEGALGTVPDECSDCVVSPEFPVFALDLHRVLPETLDIYFRTPSVWPALSGASTGTNVRRRRLNPNDFLAYQMPLPPMSVQRQLRDLRQRADRIRTDQTAAAVELDALLPSILGNAFQQQVSAKQSEALE
jgi:type I restriction enzyme S subunit